MRVEVLYGRDHTEANEIGIIEVSDRIALSSTAGPKPGTKQDRNEVIEEEIERMADDLDDATVTNAQVSKRKEQAANRKLVRGQAVRNHRSELTSGCRPQVFRRNLFSMIA